MTNNEKSLEESLKINMLLQQFFGEGSGEPNLQIDLAQKAIQSLLSIYYKIYIS